MVHLKNQAWQILAKCEKLTGYWPYQSKIKNYLLRILSTLLFLSFIFALGLRLIKELNYNLHIVLENITLILTGFCILAKILTICTQGERRCEIFEQVAMHFDTIVQEDEAKILREFSNNGLMFTIWTVAIMGLSIGLFFILPALRMFFYYFFGDGELEKIFPMYVDFLVDEQEYYFYILGYLIFISIPMGITADFTFDLNFFLSVRHVCALFEIVKLRVAKASEIFEQCDPNNEVSDSDEEEAYTLISSAIDLHNEVLQLTETIDETFQGSMFIIPIFNAMIFAPFPVTAMLYLHNPFELVRRFGIFVLFLVHFYVLFLQGQMTIDYSSSVFDVCYGFCWYKAPKRFRVAISIMMYQSMTPRQLTGGNLFELSMETYSVMLKTAVSYISMFAALDIEIKNV